MTETASPGSGSSSTFFNPIITTPSSIRRRPVAATAPPPVARQSPLETDKVKSIVKETKQRRGRSSTRKTGSQGVLGEAPSSKTLLTGKARLGD